MEVGLIIIKTKSEIEGLRAAGRIEALTFKEIEKVIKPGVELKELDKIVEQFIHSQGAENLYRGIRQRPHQRPFPGVITASINNEICHGIPDGRILKSGDIVGIDIGLKYEGWCGDSCMTYLVGKVNPEARRLVKVAKECLMLGISAARPGKHVGAIGAAIEVYANKRGYSVVREYGGHGIGRNLWEEPFIPHVGPSDRGPILRGGMVINIEPMVNIGKPNTRLMSDEWTVVTADGSLSAQFEHTIVITKNKPDILSIVS